MAEVSVDERSDFEKAQEFIRDQVKSQVAELMEAQRVQEVARPAVPQPDAAEQARKQLQEVIDPFIKPGLDDAKFQAADARDYVDFYQGNDLALEYKTEVEDAFNKAREQGRALPRKDILRWLVGREATEQPDKYTERQQARAKRELDRASNAADFGVGSAAKEKADTTFANFSSLTLDEMEKALDGVVF